MPGPMDAMMGGMPPGGGGPGPGGMPPMGGGMPGMGGPDPAASMSISAMDGLLPKSPNPTEALSKVDKALQIAHDLVMACLSNVGQWNPKLQKELHSIGKSLLAAKMDLKKEEERFAPPPSMGMGTGGPMGLPSSAPGLGSPAANQSGM